MKEKDLAEKRIKDLDELRNKIIVLVDNCSLDEVDVMFFLIKEELKGKPINTN